MPGSDSKFLSPEEVCSAIKTEELKKPEKKQPIDEILAGFTEKQKKYALLSLTHPHKTDKERKRMAGYSTNSDITPAGMKKIEGALGELLLEIGINAKDLAEGIRDGLKATKLIFRKEPVYEKGDSGKIVGYKDKEIREPDNATRNKMLEMLVKSGNYLPQKTKKVQHDHTHHLSNGGPMSMEKLRAREIQLTKQIVGDFEVVDAAEPVAS